MPPAQHDRKLIAAGKVSSCLSHNQYPSTNEAAPSNPSTGRSRTLFPSKPVEAFSDIISMKQCGSESMAATIESSPQTLDRKLYRAVQSSCTLHASSPVLRNPGTITTGCFALRPSALASLRPTSPKATPDICAGSFESTVSFRNSSMSCGRLDASDSRLGRSSIARSMRCSSRPVSARRSRPSRSIRQRGHLGQRVTPL